MSTYTRRMINVVQSSGTQTAYRVAWADSAAKRAKRKAAKAARRRNR